MFYRLILLCTTDTYRKPIRGTHNVRNVRKYYVYDKAAYFFPYLILHEYV